jgi:7,8-dihydroneopterin aldolase/epimerase/oxygenase
MGPADAVIQLRGIRCMCICGALPEEQSRRQPYEFDVDLVADIPATESDRLDETIDYGAVLDRIDAITRDESFQLFERMTQRVAEVVLLDPRVTEVTVEVRKLHPPVPQDVASAGMRLTRRRR